MHEIWAVEKTVLYAWITKNYGKINVWLSGLKPMRNLMKYVKPKD